MTEREADATVHTSRRGIVSGAYHHHLVTDRVRVAAYRRAIAARVRRGDVVADLGSGSGLLAGMAARAGAHRVYAVEIDAEAAARLRAFVAANGLGDVVQVEEADAEKWTPPERVDVVVCEMMETGLMNEDQVPVMNHVHRAWPHPPRDVIPESASLRLMLAHAPDERHGFRLLLPHFERERSPVLSPMTNEAEYANVDFRAPHASRVDATTRLVATHDGDANALVLVTRTDLGGGVSAPPSSDHASPLVLPLEAPLEVREGEALAARIRYELGSVTGRVSVDVTREGF